MAVVALAAVAGIAASELGASLTVIAVAQAVGSIIGSIIDAAIFAPAPQNVQGPRLDSLRATQADYGAAIPNSYGTVCHAGTMIWQDTIEEVAKRKKTHQGGMLGIGGQTTKTTTYTYRCSFAIAICDNPIFQVTKIFADGKIIWGPGALKRDKKFSQDTIARDPRSGVIIAGPQGDVRMGAGDIADDIRFYNGDQIKQDSLMVAKLGSAMCPIFRGVSYIVFERMHLKDYGNRVPNLKFEYTTISEKFDLLALQGNEHGMSTPTIFSGTPVSLGSGTWALIGEKNGHFHVTTHVINKAKTASLIVDDIEGPLLLSTVDAMDTSVSPDGRYVASYVASGDTVRVAVWDSITKHWWTADAPGLHLDRTYGAELIWIGQLYLCVMSVDQITGLRLYHTFKNGRAYVGTGYDSCFAAGHPTAGGIILTDCVAIADGDGAATFIHSAESEIWSKKVTVAMDLNGAAHFVFSAAFKVCGVPNRFSGQGNRGFLTETQDHGWLIASASYLQGRRSWIATGEPRGDGSMTITRQPYQPSEPATGTEMPVYIGTHGVGVFAFGSGVSLYAEYQFTATSFGITRHRTVVPGVIIPTNTNTGRSYWAVSARPGFVGMWPDPTDVNRFQPIKVYDTPDGVPVADIVADRLDRSGYMPTDYDVSQVDDTVLGYIVDKPMPARNSIDPLQYYSLFDLVDSDGIIKGVPRSTKVNENIPFELVGAIESGGEVQRSSFSRVAEADLPYRLILSFLDPDRDYQINAVLAERFGGFATQESSTSVPICCSTSRAKGMATQSLQKTWGERISLQGSFPLDYMHLDVGDIVTYMGMTVRLTKTTIGAGTLDFEGHQVMPVQIGYSLPAFGGTYQNQVYSPVPDSFITVLDIPSFRDGFADTPALTVGVTQNGNAKAWRGAMLVKSGDGGGTYTEAGTASSLTNIGTLAAPLGISSPAYFDHTNVMIVTMPAGVVLSSTPLNEAHLGNGALCIDNEIIYYATAIQTDATTWHLSDLLRGRRGTEDVILPHAAGTYVVMLDDGVTPLQLDFSDIGRVQLCRAITAGLTLSDADGQDVSATPIPACVRCLSPVHVNGKRATDGTLSVTWTRRSRTGTEWTDYQDAPLFENAEVYEIDVLRAGTVIRTMRVTSPSVTYTAADQITDFGTLNKKVYLAVYQCGAVGRGSASYSAV